MVDVRRLLVIDIPGSGDVGDGMVPGVVTTQRAV